MQSYRRPALADAAAVAAAPCSLSRGADAQSFPDKPNKVVEPFAAGSATNLEARRLAELQGTLKKPAIAAGRVRETVSDAPQTQSGRTEAAYHRRDRRGVLVHHSEPE